jgi:glycosyltransferase involved in cell wall biosynthesis
VIAPFSMVAPLVAADGYGQSAERLILAATDLGADVQFVAYDWQERQWADPRLLALEVDQLQIGMRDLVVIYFLPYAVSRFAPLARRAVLMTMFETDSIPQAWIPCCDAADGVVVPSEFCRQAFEQHLKVPVEVAPLGVDTGFFEPVVRIERDDRPFIFLMAGLLHYRKGAEFAVRALQEEFNGADDVRLILKTRRGFLDVGDADLQDPRIEVLDVDYSREQMRALYRDADCFLAPSRGEAAGLTPREAMATGLPTILTDWSGLAEIADDRYSYPVEVEGLEPAPPRCSSYDAGVAGNLPIGNFARPSIESLRAQMRCVYEHRAVAYGRGLRAAQWMARDWNWRVCAERWLDVLGRLSA